MRNTFVKHVLKTFISELIKKLRLKMLEEKVDFEIMSKYSNLNPPAHVRGMTVLDKSKFNKIINVPVVKVKNLKVSDVLPFLKKILLKLENLQSVTHNEDVHNILLNPESIKEWNDIDSKDRESLAKVDVTDKNLHFQMYTLTYENFSGQAIFRAVLPEDKEGLASFSKIGHIIHINLREHLLPYKTLIGQVLYDKVPNVRTVINKVDMIDNTYRNFKMEVLCGYNEMMVKVKENKCYFEFDFSFVYWNPRLCTEHERIINMLSEGDILFDIFAGVGPFAIPAAKKKCTVYANDLNPESYKWLNHNASINRIKKNLFFSYSKDGRDFILTDLRNKLLEHYNDKEVFVTPEIHITMNLPASAIDFVCNFYGLYNTNELPLELKSVPIVHLYCFAKGEKPYEIARSLLENNLNCDISDCLIDIFKIRTVSSMKEMMRITFKLKRDILVGDRPRLIKRKIEHLLSEEEDNKKLCCIKEEKE